MWVEFTADPNTFQIDDQWMVGKDLLVKPVYSEVQTLENFTLRLQPSANDHREP
jgi:alpha-glucosidase (family GH31 glycosyl hydrolase)